MKVFLMFPDRDFDPDQPLPSNAAALRQDLELEVLFEAMAQGDKFLYKVAQQAIFSSLDDLDVIRYRQEILKDCLKNPDVIRQIYQIPIQSIENKQRHWLGIFTRYPSGILSGAREMLGMFVELLKSLRHIADSHGDKFESRGFRRFFQMIQEELDDEYFDTVTRHLKELKFRSGVLLSASLGRGNEGTNYILCKTNHSDQSWIKRVVGRKSPVYSYTLHPRDDHGARALGELRDRGVNLVANAVAQSADHIDSFFSLLRMELAFYMGCLNLADELSQLEEPITFPDPSPANERRLAFTGLYDPTLALTMKSKVVGNDLDADRRELILITGANQGGKSTFLRSLGLAQLMMQAGMYVSANSFSANLCGHLYTHYKREEDTGMTSGKLDEELSRMSAIIDEIKPNALLLLNESFAATNEREGSEIARQIINGLLEANIKVIYVTHLFELAHSYYLKKSDHIKFLRAERKDDGERTFKVVEGEPMQTSFGIDVYNQVFETDQSETADQVLSGIPET